MVGNYNAELVAGDDCKVNKSKINFQIQVTLTPDEVLGKIFLYLYCHFLYQSSLSYFPAAPSLFSSPVPLTTLSSSLSLPPPQRRELKLDWVKAKWLKLIVVIISGHHNYTYPYGVPLFHSTFFSWSCLLFKVPLPTTLSSFFPSFCPSLPSLHALKYTFTDICNNSTNSAFSSGEVVVGTVEVDVPPSHCPHHIDISQNDQIIDHINNSCFLREMYGVHLEVLTVPSVALVLPGLRHGLLLVSHGEWLEHM